MATAAYIPAGQFPLQMGPAMTYELDQMGQQTYHATPAGYIPTTAHPQQQQVFLTSGQPVQVVTGPGGTVFPQMRFQNPNTGVYMQHPQSNIMFSPFAGDLHAPPAYSDIDASRFPTPRSRKSSFSMNFSAGQFGFPHNQMSQMGNQMDYSYVDNCMLCRANHPGPHPHGPNMGGIHDMPAMSTHRQMSMDDTMSNSSKMRNSAYSYEGPACDPMDWNPGFRARDRRDPSWDYRAASKHDPRSRSRSRGPGGGGRPGRMSFNGPIQVSEISDNDNSEDDTASRGGRMTNYGNPQRRSSSQRPPRPQSRGGRPMSTSGNSYL
ncbi:hypothetical protein TWF506_005218 [Arthrobotrys conoides]|uniref:Uncharacterized protein n=1 Tax=Arthrobotrys conoides TaxID=74498 RepID=A0AAN8NTP6_9PEZI